MSSGIIFVGCGSANLFAALYLMDNGFNPKDITVIESGSEPRKRTSMLKGFAGAGLKSDGKFVFSMHEDPLSKHITDDEKKSYYKVIQDIMERYLKIPESGISYPVYNDELDSAMLELDSKWGTDSFCLRQSEVWHIGTDNELVMAISMYDDMVEKGVNFMFKTTVTDIDFQNQVIHVYRSDRSLAQFSYDYVQIGVGKVGVDFADQIIKKYGIGIDSGYANVGGRFETKCSDTIKEFADTIQYDFKFLKEYNDGKTQVRSFCTCNYSAYVIEEGIDGTRTYNGHAYGKNHEKENGMTNFGVMARLKGIDAQAFHKSILSKFGKGGCVIRGYRWDGDSTINKVENEITWHDLFHLYNDIPGGGQLVLDLQDFINRMNNLFKINDNYSYYIPEIKMATGVVDTDRNYKLSDGRYPNVSWAGDSTTGSVGIVPAAVTGIRGIEYLTNK